MGGLTATKRPPRRPSRRRRGPFGPVGTNAWHRRRDAPARVPLHRAGRLCWAGRVHRARGSRRPMVGGPAPVHGCRGGGLADGWRCHGLHVASGRATPGRGMRGDRDRPRRARGRTDPGACRVERRVATLLSSFRRSFPLVLHSLHEPGKAVFPPAGVCPIPQHHDGAMRHGHQWASVGRAPG
jgi:hypothetical protein